MRGSTVFVNASALCGERTTRSSVWQPTQLSSWPFCWSVPGMLAIHSPLDSCAARLDVLLSTRFLLEGTFTEEEPWSSYPAARTFSEYLPGASFAAGKA